MTPRRSKAGVALGAIIALGVPVAYVILARFVDAAVLPYEPMHKLLDLFGAIGWIALVALGPIGLIIAAWSAGVRGIMAWLSTLIVGLPLVALVWFAGAASLSGALGNPA